MKVVQRRNGQTIADLDLLIAATAKKHDLIIATLNQSHFSKIDGIKLENWG